MHNVLIIFYIAFSIGNLFILPELEENQGFLFLPGQNKRCFGAYFQVKPAQVRNMGNAFCELQKAFPESFTEKPGRQNSSGPAAREEAFMTVAPPLTDTGIEARV